MAATSGVSDCSALIASGGLLHDQRDRFFMPDLVQTWWRCKSLVCKGGHRMKKIVISVLFGLGFAVDASLAQRPIDTFFSDFTAEWMRGNPDLATAMRYFTGEEQDRLERRLTPQTDAYRRGRIKLAERGLADLRKFDRSAMSETQRISAELMDWQLETIAKEQPYLDYSFPLNQFNGVNVNIVETMTVRHPLAKERDAVNYVAALGQVSARMNEAIAEARRLAAKNMLPPRFIVQATLAQMKQFIAMPPS
jgi:uncharacterized protein (DUF885 family)